MKSIIKKIFRSQSISGGGENEDRGSDQIFPSFEFFGEKLLLFVHQHNCGRPPKRMTERSLELSVADYWLNEVGSDAIEIGAVTPYYWPRRLSRVVDPADDHPDVTDRLSFLDIDCSGSNVLSISTFEHIGLPQYGQHADAAMLRDAFEKLFQESPRFLVTVPTGYNAACDEYLSNKIPANVCLSSFTRGNGDTNAWQLNSSPTVAPYGRWANGVFVLTRDFPVRQGS